MPPRKLRDRVEHVVRTEICDIVGHVSEKILRCALAASLRRSGLEVQEEVTIPVFARDRIVGHNRIDLLVHAGREQCVVELKRLRVSLHKSPARVRAVRQVTAYRRTLERLATSTADISCLVVNVFPCDATQREIVEVHRVHDGERRKARSKWDGVKYFRFAERAKPARRAGKWEAVGVRGWDVLA